MKKIKLFSVILILSLLLAGCNNFKLATSIDDLISPVSPSGDNAGVQNAVSELCKSGYLIKIPSGGDYTTSYIFHNLDSDENDEAIAFYEPSDDRGTVSLAVLKKSDDKWSVIDNIKGEGSDVKSVDFCDVNDDGAEEILVCWSFISKSTTFKLSVYSQGQTDGEYKLKPISDSITAGEFVCADINEDKVNEVVVFNIGSSGESPSAQLYSFKNNRKSLIGETKLDSTIISFESITCGVTDEGMSIYADALKSDGDSMLTEFIYWSNYYDSIVSPFYSYSTGRTADTTRSSLIDCKDIDGDKTIEIPLDLSVKNLPSQITAQNWVAYGNTVLNHKCYSYSCKRDAYSLVIDDNVFSKLSVKYDNDKRMLSAVSNDSKKECFSIVTVIKSAYNSDDERFKNYTQIFSNSGFVYLAGVNSQADIKFSVEDLKNMIKPY